MNEQEAEQYRQIAEASEVELVGLRRAFREHRAEIERLNAQIGGLIKALQSADYILAIIRNVPGNTLNPHQMSSEALEIHSMIREELGKSETRQMPS